MSIDPKKTPVTLLSQSHPSVGSIISHVVRKIGCDFMTLTAFTKNAISQDRMHIFSCNFFQQVKETHGYQIITKKYKNYQFHGVLGQFISSFWCKKIGVFSEKSSGSFFDMVGQCSNLYQMKIHTICDKKVYWVKTALQCRKKIQSFFH